MKRRDDGFVLLEVLIAAAVLATGATLYYQVLSNAVRSASQADRRYRAALLLGKEVCETELLDAPASTADKEEDPDLGPVQWTIERKTDLITGIKSWQVGIRWMNRDQPEDLTLDAIP
ncbi:MAG: prepilin-type N-terminal cleavage/methylation domain-containing protein [Elusimicrobia bacterium]|nr:prepilin-type N-terminal cleavage/methylation domain-containing protein [Elusimicrobiota bacterium]